MGNLQREQGKGRDQIKLKKTTITTKKRNRILNKIKTKHNNNNNNVNKLIVKRYKRGMNSRSPYGEAAFFSALRVPGSFS